MWELVPKSIGIFNGNICGTISHCRFAWDLCDRYFPGTCCPLVTGIPVKVFLLFDLCSRGDYPRMQPYFRMPCHRCNSKKGSVLFRKGGVCLLFCFKNSLFRGCCDQHRTPFLYTPRTYGMHMGFFSVSRGRFPASSINC